MRSVMAHMRDCGPGTAGRILSIAALLMGSVCGLRAEGDRPKPRAAASSSRAAAPTAGPHPDWLAGPDGPIMPDAFNRKGPPFVFAPSAGSGAGAVAGACAPPVIPPCVEASATSRSEAARDQCVKQLETLAPQLFAYRQCMEARVADEIRAFNRALSMAKCGGAETSKQCR